MSPIALSSTPPAHRFPARQDDRANTIPKRWPDSWLSLSTRLDHAAHAGRIDGNRFLDKAMLAGFYGVGQRLWAKVWWLGENYHIDAAVDYFLISIETHEQVVVVNSNAVLY